MSRYVRAAACLAAAILAGCAGDRGDASEVQLVEGTRSEARFPDARLQFDAPEPGTAVDTGAVQARLSLEGFPLAEPTEGVEQRGLAFSEKGQHVHFIVDDEPYRALYSLEGSVEVSGLEPGLHVLRAFPSRSWHESVKSEGAFASTWFTVGDTAAAESWDPGAPRLTYSRPKGSYSGSAADSIMVDFYLTNVRIGAGQDQHKVRLTVDDSLMWTLTRWAPHYVVGLPSGEHSFELELVQPDGSLVPGRFNATERVISVESAAGSGSE